eukprot:1152853-Pelagomonas_calceolata.AAC.3
MQRPPPEYLCSPSVARRDITVPSDNKFRHFVHKLVFNKLVDNFMMFIIIANTIVMFFVSGVMAIPTLAFLFASSTSKVLQNPAKSLEAVQLIQTEPTLSKYECFAVVQKAP